MAKAIMIQGTMSNAGKSLVAAGLCRIFAQDGWKAAPFKSQNMALNSYITKEGLEIGRAQAVQAEAAGVEPRADMNPILLKPTTDVGSQVILRGKPIGNMSAKDYFSYKRQLVPMVRESYERLAREFDVIVIEGAGSPAEINLNQEDIVNMGMAAMADAPVLLVGDIDRGGVFAQLYGTVSLLKEEDRRRIKGLVVNKFRGDPGILEPGIRMLEELCGVPVTGVVPYMQVDLEEEDSLSQRLLGEGGNAPCLVDIAVIRFPRISNYTDLAALEALEGVGVRYVSQAAKLGEPDLLILPGTKNTISDLLWLRESGLEAAVLKLAARQVPVWGICGGYQMMGEKLWDPMGVEGEPQAEPAAGMGLLPLTTVFREEKVLTRIQGAFGELDGCLGEMSGLAVSGYEIHMGETVISGNRGPEDTAKLVDYRAEPEICRPLSYTIEEGDSKKASPQGWNRGNVYGSYLHGIFDSPQIAARLTQCLAAKKGVSLEEAKNQDYESYRQSQYDKLARELRKSLDMEGIYRMMGLETARPAFHISLDQVLPNEIEAKSFEVIGRELEEIGIRLDPVEEPVIKRAIHASADFDYAKNLVFSPGAVKRAREALSRGCHIVTDTRMAWSGVNKTRLKALGGEAFTFMGDEDVAQKARDMGCTRATASMEKAADLYGKGGELEHIPCIFAIGNAPTALVRLYELVRQGRIAPALIIGMPVGFVNVVQSKELILTLDEVPYIVARGRKGGSNVAAAVCNALIYGL